MNVTTQQHVKIIVREIVAETWEAWFAPLHMTPLSEGGTQLSGFIPDQAALHGILNQLRDLNLTIILVHVE